jgi:serine/threonine protein kinase
MYPTPPTSPTQNGFCAPEDRLGQILAGRLQLTSILGVGAYGVVYTAVDMQTNMPYAVKALNKVGLEPRQRKFQQREIQLHHQASAHPNVVSLVKIMDAVDCTYVVIEYATMLWPSVLSFKSWMPWNTATLLESTTGTSSPRTSWSPTRA